MKYKNLILRDGVDLYFDEELNTAIFVFLATRKKVKVLVDSDLLLIVSKMDGSKDLKEYLDDFNLETFRVENFFKLVEFLYHKNILIEKNWIDLLDFDKNYKELYDRQFKYLLDITDDGIQGIEKVQKRIYNTKVAIFGLGAVGASTLKELAMLGFVDFILIDYDTIDYQDVSRNILFNNQRLDEKKITLAKEMLLKINPDIKVSTVFETLDINTNLDFIDDCDLIINSANTPYIGYTSIKLSRYCIKANKLLFICGGFDAHLASLGELIVPGETPCSDCYTTYFTETLKDWKPIKHPIENREKVFGGLISLSLFSASVAVLTILKYFIDGNTSELSRRGEFLFDDYSIYEFNVPRDENCLFCAN